MKNGRNSSNWVIRRLWPPYAYAGWNIARLLSTDVSRTKSKVSGTEFYFAPKLPGPCLTEEGWVSGCVSNLESWAVWLARSYSALLCAEGNRAAVQNWSFRPLKSHATGRGVLTQTQSCRHPALLRFPFQIHFLFMLLRLLRENNIQVTCLVISMQAISF